MELQDENLVEIYFFKRPWLLDIDNAMLIDREDNSITIEAFKDDTPGFYFLYPKFHNAANGFMEIRLITYDVPDETGKKWYELHTSMDNNNSIDFFNVNKDRYYKISLMLMDPYYNGPGKANREKNADNPIRVKIVDPEKRVPFTTPVTSEGISQFYGKIYFEDGFWFDIDFENLRLINHLDHQNVIDLREVRDTGTVYEFYYDPDSKNIAQVPADFKQGDSGAYLVRFRYLVSLHPYAMSVCNHVPYGKISAKTDKEFMEKAAQWKAQHQSLQKVKHIAQTNKGKKRRGKSM